MLWRIKKALQHKDNNIEPNVPAYTLQYYMLWLSGDPAHSAHQIQPDHKTHWILALKNCPNTLSIPLFPYEKLVEFGGDLDLAEWGWDKDLAECE